MRAIGSGGLFGAGYQKGYMTQRGMVPKQWTDFIFSAAGEEFGFIGSLLVLILLTLIIVRLFYISRSARNTVGSLMCFGVMAIFISQTVENIGMCLGLLPVIGITLPFFSYGGSSILGSLLGIGVVLSVNSRKNIYYFTRDENLDKF
jgi:rod shape determining protein RodA